MIRKVAYQFFLRNYRSTKPLETPFKAIPMISICSKLFKSWLSHCLLLFTDFHFAVFCMYSFVCIYIFTDRVRSTTEGNVFTRVCPSIHPSVCPQGGGGVPHLAGDYPSQVHLGGGVPRPGPDGGGDPQSGPDRGYPGRSSRGVPLVGVPPHQFQMGVPQRGVNWGYPQTGIGYSLAGVPPTRGTPRYRTTDGVLNTPRSVCLLRSRRRTFLYIYIFVPFDSIQVGSINVKNCVFARNFLNNGPIFNALEPLE